jgi:hypothetical protein
VRIEPFYDRTLLVDRTIKTVGTNLLEGAALVVLVLLLVLGDLRAGLVVATTIPLSMLFAVIVMNASGPLGQPDEPRRDRLRAHRRRLGDRRRERGAAPLRGQPPRRSSAPRRTSACR